MTTNVVSLTGDPITTPESNASCVETLREWLAMAEAGEIVGVAIAGPNHDGLVRWATGGENVSFSMIGALSVMQATLVERCAETIEDNA